MPARSTQATPGALALAGLAWLVVAFHAGPAWAFVAAIAVAAGAVALASSAPTRNDGLRRQLNAGMTLCALHAASLYTFADTHAGSAVAVHGVLAVLGVAVCAMLGARVRVDDDPAQRPSATLTLPALTDVRSAAQRAREEDPDHTLEIEVNDFGEAPALQATALAPLAVATAEPLVPARPMRGPLVAAIAASALLIVSTLFWLGGEPHDGMANAAATVLPRTAVAATVGSPVGHGDASLPAIGFESPAAASETGSAGSAATELPPSPPPAASPATRPLAPSAARRECMAQIESARLFLQIFTGP